MRRKPLIFIFVLVALACGLFGVACKKKHEHSWGEWETVTAPTCTAEGSRHRFCTECEEEETEVLQKIPHNKVDVEKVDATCLVAGREAGVECSVCGEKISGFEIIPALGHDYGDSTDGGWILVKEASCTDQGLRTRVCLRDGCGYLEEDIIPLKEHTIVPIGNKVDPGCTTPGMTAGEKCSVCQHVIQAQQPIDPLGHEMRNPVHVQENGVDCHSGACSRCEKEITKEPCVFTVVKTAATCTKAEHHVHTCPTCNYEYEHDEGEPLGHNYGDWHFDVAAYDASLRDRDGAETVVRQHKRVCSNPGHVEDPDDPDTLPCIEERVGEAVAATCISSGYTNYRCTECENTYTGDRVNALGHDWEKNEDGTTKYTTIYYEAAKMYVHYKTCTRDGCPQPTGTYYACRYDTLTYEAANCEHGKTKVFTCLDCKQEIRIEEGEPLGHSYGAWMHDDSTSGETSKHYRVCGRAGCEHRDEALCEMQSSNDVATCQKPGREIDICKDCKYTVRGDEIAQLDHDLADQPYVADHANHRHYQECKRCKTKVYEACPYGESVRSMTCTTDEVTTYTCPTCNDSYTAVTAKSTGHRVTQYDESNKFYHTGRCDECSELVSVEHDFSDSNICRVCSTDGLSYAFETGSGNTKARVIRTFKNSTPYNINAAKIVIPATVDIDGNGSVPVVGISSDAFFGNRYIEEVELPLSLEYIGYHAFQGCTSLANVHFAGHEAGAKNVSDCKLNRIENAAFKDCTSLADAILPSTLQYIGQEAFRGCTKLNDIDIPDLVTEIEDHAFTDTAYFLSAENWGDKGVLYIGKHLIRAQTSLSGTYTVDEGVVSISAEAFMDCVFLERIELPASLKAVDRDAFKGCTSLASVEFKGTFEQYLGIRFDNNEASPMHVATALTISGESGTLTIPEEATVIPAGAFRGSAIESIVIPANVTSIGANAFADCSSLTEIKFAKESKIISIGKDVVANTPFYNTERNWTDGVLYIKDEEETPVALVGVNKDKVTAEYVNYESESFDGTAKKVVIASGTRVVAPEAFKDFTLLRYVEVPETVVYFGAGVFSGCTGLDRVNLRGTGLAWFCISSQLGRVYTDAAVYGGADGTDYSKQEYVANMFKVTYPLEWKRGNYGSGS